MKLIHEETKPNRFKTRFRLAQCNTRGYWYDKITGQWWHDDEIWDGTNTIGSKTYMNVRFADGVSSSAYCRSIRAFRRMLKRQKHKGLEFTLVGYESVKGTS